MRLADLTSTRMQSALPVVHTPNTYIAALSLWPSISFPPAVPGAHQGWRALQLAGLTSARMHSALPIYRQTACVHYHVYYIVQFINMVQCPRGLLAGGVGGVESATACPPSFLNLRGQLRLCTQRCTAAGTLQPCGVTHSHTKHGCALFCLASLSPLQCQAHIKAGAKKFIISAPSAI
jgi:hypothetical protein